MNDQSLPWPTEYRTWSVQRASREPLIRFLCDNLVSCGCRLLFVSDPKTAPFRITFEAPDGERQGIVAYAFLANRTPTKNRPADERSFQIKYGSKESAIEHPLWELKLRGTSERKK